MKYRIKIEEIQQRKFKHIHNIMIEVNGSIQPTIIKIKKSLEEEINKRDLIRFNNITKLDMIDKLIIDTPKGIIDFDSKGKDISKKEFLKNEIDLEVKLWK